MALMLGFNELILIQMMADLRRGQGWLLHLCLGEMEHLCDGGLVLAVKMIEHHLSVE